MAEKKNYNVDDIYNSIAYTETGIYDDPWIRTKGLGSGSSAYGPLQMTGGKTSKMWDAAMDEYQNKMINPNEAESEYLTRFLGQANEFLANVDEKERYGTTYGYAGSGVLTSDKDKALYESISKKIIKFELEHRYNGNVEEFIKAWRGPTKKYKKKDPGNKSYFDKFWNHLDRLTTERKNLKDTTLLKPDEAIMDTIGRIPQ